VSISDALTQMGSREECHVETTRLHLHSLELRATGRRCYTPSWGSTTQVFDTFRHHANLAALQAAASDGCRICRALLRYKKPLSKYQEDGELTCTIHDGNNWGEDNP